MHSRRRFLQIVGTIGVAPLLSSCDLFKEIFSPPPMVQVPEIKVVLKEWQIVPGRLAAQAGKVRFLVSNQGTMIHGFEIEGVGFEEEIEPFPAGQTRTLELELPPGTYEVYCQVPGHKELGMEGELVIAPTS